MKATVVRAGIGRLAVASRRANVEFIRECAAMCRTSKAPGVCVQ